MIIKSLDDSLDLHKRTSSTDSLTVGLAIGIPSFVVILAISIFWFRNQRKQNKEDLMENSIDMELQDNQSFEQFEEELHRPYRNNHEDSNNSNSNNSHIDDTGLKDDKVSDDQDQDKDHEFTKEKIHSSSNSNTNSNIESTDLDINGKRHSKNNSAYDFYETFIPILPNRESTNSLANNSNPPYSSRSRSQSQSQSQSDIIEPPSTPGRIGRGHKSNDSLEFSRPQIPNSPGQGTTSESQNSSVTSLSDKDKRYSLDNLAKQLQQQGYFEKLPSRANTIRPTQPSPFQSQPPSQPPSQPQTPMFERPNRLPTSSHNNSSQELVNKYTDNDAINDSYVYGSNTRG